MKILNNIPSFDEDDKAYFMEHSQEILNSGILIAGNYTHLLETEVKKSCGANYAVAVSSGSAALEIILKFINCENCEVLLPNNTFISTLYAVQNAKGKPVLVDINLNDFCIDIDDMIDKINDSTKALILVHLGGHITERIKEIREICEQKGIFIIEDSSHAFGAKYEEWSAGNIGFASACSFYPTKIVTGGTGGVLTTNNLKLYEYALLSRSHGTSKNGINHFLSPNWYMSEFNALLCYKQIKKIEEIIDKRNDIAKRYSELIINNYSSHLQIQPLDDNRRHPYYKYIVKTTYDLSAPLIIEYFQKKNIDLGTCYSIQLNQHPSIKNSFNYNLKNSEYYASNHFTLPCHLNLSMQNIERILYILKCFFKKGIL